MLDARDFLDVVAGYSNAPTNGPKSSAERPIRLGTIDQYYTAGPAKVLFDGETVISSRGYSWSSTYTPTAGERVYLLPVGQTYLIVGSITSAITYPRYYNLALNSGFTTYNSSFHNPSFTKTTSGLVKLTGLGANTNTGILANNTVIGTLPVGFRPPINMLFPAMSGSANAVGTIGVETNGNVVVSNNISGVWFSFGNIVFQTQDLSWTTPTLVNGWELGASSGRVRPAQYSKDSLNRTLLRGSFGESGTSKTADTAVFNIDATNRPGPQGVYTVGTSLLGSAGGFAHTFANSANGDFLWRPGSANDDEVSIDGIIFPDKSATWIAPTLTNAWVSYGASNTPGYYKDDDGVVHLRGLLKSGTIASSMFTLPIGYRPAKNIIRNTVSNAASGRLDITSAGLVIPQTGSNVWVSVDSVAFTAEA